MSVLHSTRSIMLSYSIDCLFRSGSRDQHSIGCVFPSWIGHKQFNTVGPSRSVLLCVPEWFKDRCLDLSSTFSTPPTSSSWSNRSGSVSICMRMIRSSMGPARYQRRLVWLAVPCALSTRSKFGCRQTIFGWMLIRPSSFGWAQVTSSESATCRRSIQSCRLPMFWTFSESTLTLERQVSKFCQVCYFHLRRLRTVRRSLSKECLQSMPSPQHYITLHYITLHYITLHYITLHYITLHYITLHYITLHYITLHYITLHYITLHYITLHYITLHYITLHYITLHYITLHYITLHYITLHYITLHYITLHYITLHYITLHYITLHYITLHYITYIIGISNATYT